MKDQQGQGVLVFVLLMIIFVVVIVVLAPVLGEAINGLFEVTKTLGGTLP